MNLATLCLPSRRARRLLLLVAGVVGCAPDGPAADSAVPAPGTPEVIASPADSGASFPHLAVTAAGQPVLSWTQRAADSTVSIRLASWSGAGWDSVRTVTSGRPYFVNWADFPSVTVLGNGELAAHWLEREGTSKYAYGIRVVRSTDGGRTWSAPVTPHTDGLAAEHGFVSLWAEGDDRLGLVWLDGRKSAMPDSAREMTIRTAEVAPDGTLHREQLVDARSCDCCQTGTAATAAGRVLVYRDRSEAEIRDIAVVRRTDSAWTAPVKVHDDDWHYPGCPVNGPQAASSGDTVVVAWYTAAHDTARVQVARSTDGGATFAAPIRVDDGRPIGRVDVQLDAQGRALVSWLETATDSVAEVRLRRVDLARGARSEARVLATTGTARASGFPRLVRAGNALFAAWTTLAGGPRLQLARVPLD